MNILAIDTSSPVASVAVMSNGVLLGEYMVNNGKTHSQILMPMISDLLEKIGIRVSDIDVFATSLGPGSFTGLRIGIATAKALAQVGKKKIIGISALDGLCANVTAGKDVFVCPIVDARRGNVYNAIYKDGVKMVSDRLIPLDTVLAELNNSKAIFLGDGIIKHKEKIVNIMGENAIFPHENLTMQKASSIAYLANIRAENEEFDDIYSLEPIYIRPSQAERELNGEKDDI